MFLSKPRVQYGLQSSYVKMRHQYRVSHLLCLFHPQTHTEYVPCPVYECKEDKQEIVQQPADLTTLSSNLALAAISFIQKQAGEVVEFNI